MRRHRYLLDPRLGKTTKVDARHANVLRLRAAMHEQSEFREAMRRLAKIRPAIAAGATKNERTSMRSIATDDGPLLVIGAAGENRAAALYWARVGALQALLGPYTLWNGADLDWLASKVGRTGKPQTPCPEARNPDARDDLLHARDRPGRPARRARNGRRARVNCRSLAREIAGDSATDADRLAGGAFRSESAVRKKRYHWRRRLAGGSERAEGAGNRPRPL